MNYIEWEKKENEEALKLHRGLLVCVVTLFLSNILQLLLIML